MFSFNDDKVHNVLVCLFWFFVGMAVVGRLGKFFFGS